MKYYASGRGEEDGLLLAISLSLKISVLFHLPLLCHWHNTSSFKNDKKNYISRCQHIFVVKISGVAVESEKKVKSLSRVQLFCKPLDRSLLGFSIHGIFQARVLEWVAISSSKGSSQPRDRTQVSGTADRCFTF